MGEKFKLPDFKSKIPNFQQQAERTMKKVMDTSNIPDFMSIASQKMAFLKKQVEDPDIEKINKFIEKLDAAKNISSVAKALGVSLEAEQVQQVINKKNALESAIGERAFSAVSTFMEKEGYHVDSPEKIMTNVANRLQKNDDPLEVLKDTVAPFTQFAKDTLSGGHSVSAKSITAAINSNEKKGVVIQKAAELIASVEKAYSSTKYDEGLVNAALNGRLDMYDVTNLDDKTISNSLLVALASDKASDKQKNEIESILISRNPNLTHEILEPVRNDKYRKYRTEEQLISDAERQAKELENRANGVTNNVEDDSLFGRLKKQAEPAISEGKWLFNGLKEHVNTMKEATGITAKDIVPFSMQEIKSEAKQYFETSELLEPIRERQQQKEKDTFTQNVWEKEIEQMRKGNYDSDSIKKIANGDLDDTQRVRNLIRILGDNQIPDAIKKKIYSDYDSRMKDIAATPEQIQKYGLDSLKINSSVPSNIQSLIDKYLGGN